MGLIPAGLYLVAVKGGSKGARGAGAGPREGRPRWLVVAAAAAVAVAIGFVVASQAGLLRGGDDTIVSDDGEPCSTVRGIAIHEHAELFVYLNSTPPYDFSPQRYQVQESFIHLEEGAGDADGATIHIHQSRPTLACFFDTIGWQVGPSEIVTDVGDRFPVDEHHELAIFVDREPAEKGFKQILVDGQSIVVAYRSKPHDGDTNTTSGFDAGAKAELPMSPGPNVGSAAWSGLPFFILAPDRQAHPT